MSFAGKATIFFHFEEKNGFIYSENESEGDEIALENMHKIKEKRNELRSYCSTASN